MAEIPQKLFYKIGEVCQYTDTQPYVLRFWESEFPALAPEKNRSGQRVYRRQDIELIFKIKKLLYDEEFTIAGARKRLEQQAEADFEAGDGKKKAVPPRRGAKQPVASRAEKREEPSAIEQWGIREVSVERAEAAVSEPPKADEEEFLDALESAAASPRSSAAVDDLLRKLDESNALLLRTREALHTEEQRREECQRRSIEVAERLEALVAKMNGNAS